MSTTRSSRRHFLLGAAASGIGLSLSRRVRAASARPPDVIFILADDMGYADLSCYGQPDFRTPVIDRLAADGMRFIQGYANSAVCSATRTALVTGRYQQRFRIGLEEPVTPMFPGIALPAGTPTIASRFKALGYHTALVGKWHVGAPPAHGPNHYGYDYFFGPLTGAVDYFSHRVDVTGHDPKDGLWQNDRRVDRTGYLTDLLAEEAMRQIDAAGERPLLLSLHFNAPHWPWEGPHDEAHSRALKNIRDSDGGSLGTYAQMVRRMDADIGRVLERLQARGRADNAIIVFTSDNGGERYSDTWPLTGVKGELLEGGIRVPLIVNWAGRVKPGSISQQVMISMDFAPTLLAAAGAGAPAPGAFDGANLLPQLVDGATPVSRQLFWRFKANEQAAARDGDWKYLKLGGKEHLFNVATDPRERAELAADHPAIMARLKREFAGWDSQMLPYPAASFSEDVKEFYADRY